MATHASILAWKIPWMEEPGGLQSMGCSPRGHIESDTTEYTSMVRGNLTTSSWPPLDSGCSNVICHLQNVEKGNLHGTAWVKTWTGEMAFFFFFPFGCANWLAGS